MTLVSIITPTYNHEKFIGQCIESVLAQSFHDWEQIIIDDESTDKTPEIIQHYNDPRIRYFKIDHKGLSNLVKIYNEGLCLARGEIIAILEGDDFWPSDKIEKEIVAFESQEVILAWGNGVVTNEFGKPQYLRRPMKISSKWENYSSNKLLRMTMRDNPISPACTVMVRKNCILSIGGFHASPSGNFVDLSTWVKLAESYQGTFRFFYSILGFWRTHSSQATFSGRSEQLLDHAIIIRGLNIDGSDSYSKYLEARACLISRDWPKANLIFKKLILNKSIESKDRIVCALGILSSISRIDLVELTIRLKEIVCNRGWILSKLRGLDI